MSAAIVHNNAVYFECGDINVPEIIKNDKHDYDDVNGNQLSSTKKIVGSNEICQKLQIQNHKDTDQYRLHGALTRTISQPPNANMTSLVCTLIENLGNMTLHRKLERTQSEPLPQQQVNTSRYKTELCRPFEEAGECKYGEKCQFAHGYHELRNLQRHPKYKTEYCRTFHSVGFCPYGPRCHFVHNADEALTMQQQQQQSKQNHSSLQNSILSYPLPHKHNHIQHSLPLSPPLSMSTGSDRESPTESLSLSPTCSMTSFPFGDTNSPGNSNLHTAFSYMNTPPESPNAPISPVNTPPPSVVLTNVKNRSLIYIKPITQQNKLVLQKSTSSPPIAIIRNDSHNSTKVSSTSFNVDDARLPVFNRLSSAVEN